MIVRTDFPCGNGRVYWIKPGHFEVEAIAYSKAPRYVCFRISAVSASGEIPVVLRPDRYFHGNFQSFEGRIWVCRGLHGEWTPLEESRVEVSPEAIRFSLPLVKGETVTVTTETPRPYGETCRELFGLAREHPGIASVRCIGASMEERPLLVLRISGETAPSRPRRPAVFVIAGEHATEFAGEEIMRGVLSAVVGKTAAGKALRERFDFEFLLNANPDGNFHGWHQYNGRDWLAHNYADLADRSWHHEFGSYFDGAREGLSPETLAIGDWVTHGRPAFVLNAHSWLGHGGNPGAFRTAPEEVREPMRGKLETLDAGAVGVARSLGFDFEVYPSSNLCSGHLVDLLIARHGVPGYAIEGHMNLGRELSQRFGARLIERWLLEDDLLPPLRETARDGLRENAASLAR